MNINAERESFYSRMLNCMKSLSHRGISLVEVLMALVLMASIVLPIGIIMSTSTAPEAPASVQFTRNSIISSLQDMIDPDDPNFYADYNQSSTQTITDNGVTVTYLQKVYLDTGT